MIIKLPSHHYRRTKAIYKIAMATVSPRDDNKRDYILSIFQTGVYFPLYKVTPNLV